MSRIQIVVSEVEREELRGAAALEGLSLSEFLRQAARDRLAAAPQTEIHTVEGLRRFFQECDEREKGEEPDWQTHRHLIEESKTDGKVIGCVRRHQTHNVRSSLKSPPALGSALDLRKGNRRRPEPPL